MIQVELHDRSNNLIKVLSRAKNAAYHTQLNSDGTATFLIHRADPDFTTYNVAFGGIDGFIVHLLRKGPYESAFTDRFAFVVEACTGTLGQQEDAGAWWRVSGRGTLCLLEDRIAYPPGYDGTTQSTILGQFQNYVGQPGGAIIAGEIDRSNPRFSITLSHSKDIAGYPNYPTAVLADSPVGYWRMGEASGNIADSSGGAHTGTAVGGITYSVTGALLLDSNKAVTLNGSTGYFTVPTAPALHPGDTFTLEAWIKTAAVTQQALITLGTTVEATMVLTASGRVLIFSNGTIATTANAYNDSQWHHVVWTKATTSNHIYVDGADVTPTVTNRTVSAGSSPILIGVVNGPSQYVNGSLDEVAIYPTALSAARVKAHYVAGASYISQSTVLQTAQLRFDNLRKVHDYLVGNGLDGQMVGLDYQALDHRGTDKSATVTVAMAARDSLLGVTLERDASKVANYVVAQGIGEGANALLISSTDAPSITALRRREAFLSASQDSDPNQIALRANSAVTQLKAADQRITTRFIDSPHTQLYRDFDLGDTLKCVVAPIGMSQNYRCVGITVTDQDSEVEDCALDLNSIRQEYLLKLATGATLTSDGLGIVTRLPPAIMQILVNGGTQTAGPITGKASPPLGLSGVGGEVILTTGTFTLARPGNVLLEAICSDYVLTTNGVSVAAHPVYFQIDGVNDTVAYAFVPVWFSPGNAETRSLSSTIRKVATLAAGSHTVNVMWNSEEATTDIIYTANNPLFAFLLGS